MSFSYKCQISIKSINKKLLVNLFKKINSLSLKKYLKGISIKNSIFLLKKLKKLTLIRSPHVYKKSKEQFEIISNTMVFNIFGSESLKLKFFLSSFKKIIPSGVVLRIQVKEKLVF